MLLTHSNWKGLVRAGDRLLITHAGEELGVRKVEPGMKFNGGYKCCGMSIPYMLDSYDTVELVKYVF